MIYDKIIIGAGLYGLYCAQLCAERGDSVLVLEYDDQPFTRATFINQARIHMGYHYPRSYSTAVKTAAYFDRFSSEFSSCINSSFTKIYAVAANFSWTNAEQFEKFCRDVSIPCERVLSGKYFKDDACEGAFLTREHAFDAYLMMEKVLGALASKPGVTLRFQARIKEFERTQTCYNVILENGEVHSSDYLINATYASVNQILVKLGFQPFEIKYELCEIILCKVSAELAGLGLTVMDGPFFSIMPFGRCGLHSLTSVSFTPHKVSYAALPEFDCQEQSQGYCSPQQLGNCNTCPAKPHTAWSYMAALARKYLKPELNFEYNSSLFSIKPILKSSEIDDSRPTVIKHYSVAPTFITVLSGKINTIYDLEEVLP
jgi:hypothetical protein